MPPRERPGEQHQRSATGPGSQYDEAGLGSDHVICRDQLVVAGEVAEVVFEHGQVGNIVVRQNPNRARERAADDEGHRA